MTTTANASTVANNNKYTAVQEALILAAIKANGNVANQTIAEALAADPRMNDESNGKSEARTARGIIAKMSRMKDANGFTYERKVTLSKSGAPVQKKLDMVARIAERAGVAAAKLDGLEKAPKLALETLLASYVESATGTEG